VERAPRPTPQLDDLVVELQPGTAADEHVELLLLLVLVPEGDAEVGSEPLVADARVPELERDAGEAGLEVRRVTELGRLILDLPQVDDRVFAHGLDSPRSQCR
jgi:hypothetical protein